MKTLTTILFVISFSLLSSAQPVVPIFEVKSRGLLGGVENGKYLDAKTTFGRLKGEIKFTLFGINGKTGELSTPISAPEKICEEFYFVDKEFDTNQSGTAIGAETSWNPLPRTGAAINLNDKTYLKIVSDILRSKGLPQAKAKIEQAVRVDLDGDGSQEVLLTASSYGGKIQPGAKAGDYSFVLLRKVVAGKVKNIMITEEYVKKSIQFGAPNRFELSSIVDLNGDGKMEVVVYDEYYEGNGATVYEIKGEKAVNVMEAGCGV